MGMHKGMLGRIGEDGPASATLENYIKEKENLYNEIPAGATHFWDPKDNLQSLIVKRLNYYKKVQDKWYVYSNYTGWRETQNDIDWFLNETKEGFFNALSVL